jgi:hypothetical protein
MDTTRATHYRNVFVALITALSLALTSCKLKEEEETGEAPSLPPASSMVMSFSGFESGAAARDVAMSVIVATTSNYNYAATNVGVWNLVLTVGLAVPVASFVAAVNQTPKKQSDGSWLWAYNFTVAGIAHTAKLYGKVVNDTVEWDMYITKVGFYTDFHWYEGVSKIDGTQGTWTLMRDPDNAREFLSIAWNRNATAGTGDIKYTNVETGTDGEGDYIHYGTTTDATYNAYYDINDASASSLIEIEWNRTTTAGRVKNLAHFGNEDWHYWDATHQDIDAPVP